LTFPKFPGGKIIQISRQKFKIVTINLVIPDFSKNLWQPCFLWKFKFPAKKFKKNQGRLERKISKNFEIVESLISPLFLSNVLAGKISHQSANLDRLA
jgi:hypothetical protein